MDCLVGLVRVIFTGGRFHNNLPMSYIHSINTIVPVRLSSDIPPQYGWTVVLHECVSAPGRKVGVTWIEHQRARVKDCFSPSARAL